MIEFFLIEVSGKMQVNYETINSEKEERGPYLQMYAGVYSFRR